MEETKKWCALPSQKCSVRTEIGVALSENLCSLKQSKPELFNRTRELLEKLEANILQTFLSPSTHSSDTAVESSDLNFSFRRQSTREVASQIKARQKQAWAIALMDEKEDGIAQIMDLSKGPGGRGVVTTRMFKEGEFVCEYRGELLSAKEADLRYKAYDKTNVKREANGQRPIGSFMQWFDSDNVTYCVDSTEEIPWLGRLINHSMKVPNLRREVVKGGDPYQPRLILVAKRDIECGEQLFYDYGIRSRSLPFTYM